MNLSNKNFIVSKILFFYHASIFLIHVTKKYVLVIPQSYPPVIDGFISANGYHGDQIDNHLQKQQNIRNKLGIKKKGEDFLALLPIGIRKVKDPLYLIDAFHNFFDTISQDFSCNFYLVIVGPAIDDKLVESLHRKLGSSA